MQYDLILHQRRFLLTVAIIRWFLKIAVLKTGALCLQKNYNFINTVNIQFIICPKDFVDIFQKILSKFSKHY